MENLTFGPANGDLTLHTGVAGSAAKMGHRLVIGVTDWAAQVGLSGSQIDSLQLTAELPSIEVLSGEGGVKPLASGDRDTIASNAKRAMEVDRFPQVAFRADCPVAVPSSAGDYPLTGVLGIHGRERPITATLHVRQGDTGWEVQTTVAVRQSDFGIKAYSTMLGQLRVADEVAVQLRLGPFQAG